MERFKFKYFDNLIYDHWYIAYNNSDIKNYKVFRLYLSLFKGMTIINAYRSIKILLKVK